MLGSSRPQVTQNARTKQGKIHTWGKKRNLEMTGGEEKITPTETAIKKRRYYCLVSRRARTGEEGNISSGNHC